MLQMVADTFESAVGRNSLAIRDNVNEVTVSGCSFLLTAIGLTGAIIVLYAVFFWIDNEVRIFLNV